MSDGNDKFGTVEIRETLKTGTISENPICHQTLGICSALAVTGKLENTLVMCAALLFVITASNVFVSVLRNLIPRRVRIIAEMAIISTFVIVFDQVLKAYYYDMSKQLGPYVGLIITNCIVLGRAEACALASPPIKAFWDGIANSAGYTVVLVAVAIGRELLGGGTLMGYRIMPANFDACQVMLQSAGAFFMLGVIMWVMKTFAPDTE